MAVTWTISTLERNSSDDGVVVAHWRALDSEVVGTGDDAVTHSGSSYGTCGFTYDASAADFTPYDDITEAQAQGWVWGHVSQADTEAAIASKIDAMVKSYATHVWIGAIVDFVLWRLVWILLSGHCSSGNWIRIRSAFIGTRTALHATLPAQK